MSEPLCLECLFKRGRKNFEDEKEYTGDCASCIYNIKEHECIDGCGKTMIFCKMFGYWHICKKNNCFKYIKKVKK